MFKGPDNNYYYICEESPYDLKKASTSREYVKANTEFYEDSIYLDNEKLKDNELRKKCLKTMEKALNETKCTQQQYERCNKNKINNMIINIHKNNRFFDALLDDNLNAAEDKELKTVIMKNKGEGRVLKIKTDDKGREFVKENVSPDELEKGVREALCNKKGNILFNQDKLTKEEAKEAIKHAKYAEGQQKTQENRVDEAKTEDNKTARHITDEDIKELELYRKKEQAIVDFEKKLFEVRDNLHEMMNVALGKRKVNNYLDNLERENNLRGFCNVRARGKKLFNQRAWYKSGRSLIKYLNEQFDKMISIAKDVVWMNVSSQRECAHKFLEDCKTKFDDIYSFLKQKQYSIDGEIIEYKWKDPGNNTASNNLKSNDNKIKI